MNGLIAVYDMKVCPGNMEFTTFLVLAKQRADSGGSDLIVVILWETFKRKSRLYDEAEIEWRLWNILVPLCRSIGADCVTTKSREFAWELYSKAKRNFPNSDRLFSWEKAYRVGKVVSANLGPDMPRLLPTKPAIRKVEQYLSRFTRPIVTLILRESDNNFDLDSKKDWFEFAKYLEGRGFQPIIVRDSAKQFDLSASDFPAPLSIDLRLALFSKSTVSMTVPHGNMYLLWFSPFPFIGVGFVSRKDEKLAIPRGERPGFMLNKQHLDYVNDDTLSGLIESFEKYSP